MGRLRDPGAGPCGQRTARQSCTFAKLARVRIAWRSADQGGVEGQYTPIAALTQEGNAALRRALVDECPSAAELVGQLADAVGVNTPPPATP